MLLQPANPAWGPALLIDGMAVHSCTTSCVLQPARLVQPLIDW